MLMRDDAWTVGLNLLAFSTLISIKPLVNLLMVFDNSLPVHFFVRCFFFTTKFRWHFFVYRLGISWPLGQNNESSYFYDVETINLWCCYLHKRSQFCNFVFWWIFLLKTQFEFNKIKLFNNVVVVVVVVLVLHFKTQRTIWKWHGWHKKKELWPKQFLLLIWWWRWQRWRSINHLQPIRTFREPCMVNKFAFLNFWRFIIFLFPILKCTLSKNMTLFVLKENWMLKCSLFFEKTFPSKSCSIVYSTIWKRYVFETNFYITWLKPFFVLQQDKDTSTAQKEKKRGH